VSGAIVDGQTRGEQHLDLIAAIYDTALDSKEWVACARAIEEALSGAVIAICLALPRRGVRGAVVAPSFDPAFLKSYREHYATLDPFAPYVEHLAVGALESCEQYVAVTQLRQTAFYNEWMAPQGFAAKPMLRGVIDRSEHGVATIYIFHPQGAGRWRHAEQHLGELLMPHLRRAVQLHHRMAKFELSQEAFNDAVDYLPIGLMLLDAHGHILTANHAAESLIARGDGLLLDRDGLHARDAKVTWELRRAIADAAQVRESNGEDRGFGAARAILLPRTSGCRPLEALVTSLRAKEDRGDPEQPVAALFLSDPEHETHTTAKVLRRFYDFTNSEASLACELANGQSIDDAAGCLGITRESARTRVKHLMAKTDTHRQGALVRLFLGGLAQLRIDE
jgi:DNA-binding CsgD family transcriptional regulator/PAS domain-containing protein